MLFTLGFIASNPYYSKCTNNYGEYNPLFYMNSFPTSKFGFTDALNILYTSLEYIKDEKKVEHIKRCADYNNDDKLTFVDFLNMLYYQLDYIQVASHFKNEYETCTVPQHTEVAPLFSSSGRYTLGAQLVWQYRNGDINFVNQNKCPYRYSVVLPNDYTTNETAHTLVIVLHGGWTFEDPLEYHVTKYFLDQNTITSQSAILLAPTKQESDWDPGKIISILDELSGYGLNYDRNRIILTGCSMGGRGSIRVGNAFPNIFPIVRPMAPHHMPYDYTIYAQNMSENNVSVKVVMQSSDPTSNVQLASKFVKDMTDNGGRAQMTWIEGEGHCTDEVKLEMITIIKEDIAFLNN